MDDYTPSTEDVRESYTYFRGAIPLVEHEAEFERWLNEVKAEVREQAAQRIEKVLPFYTTRPTRLALRAAADIVRGV